MDIFGTILIGIVLIFIAVIVFFDPLEKYDKTLDDHDHKVVGDFLMTLRFGQWWNLPLRKRKSNSNSNMYSYSKTKLRISGVVVWSSLVVGLFGYWITNNYLFLEIAYIVIGVDFLLFSHDLATQQVVKYKFNYIFVRTVCLSVGIILIVATILSWRQ